MTDFPEEQVLVVPSSLLEQLGYFQGFCDDAGHYLDTLLSAEHVRFLPRPQMEQDPSFKQLIPYVIFRYRDDQGQVQLFQYTRGSGQGEQRLHRKRSVGIGGHLCSDDCGDATAAADDRDPHRGPYQEGMRRELEEEVEIATPYRQQCVGLINDDQTEVGAVHLGVVHVFDVEQPQVRPRESEIVDAGFRSLSEIYNQLESFETWSQICVRALFPIQEG